MQKRQFNFQPKGLNLDSQQGMQDNQYASYLLNVRLNRESDRGLLAITNEQGNLKLVPSGESTTIIGTPLGAQKTNKGLVLFTHDDIEGLDYIYNISILEDCTKYNAVLIHSKDLNFSLNYPIDSIYEYESELVQKIYWIDGNNPPRMLILNKDISYIGKPSTVFDFVEELSLEENIQIEKIYTEGSFPQGTIQYVMSYYNKYGKQSNIFYQSNLYYLSLDKGVSPDSTVQCAFKLVLDNLEHEKFDYVRVYSIVRTTRNTTPIVKRVVDLSLSSSKIEFTDDGYQGSTVDPTELLYIGGETIVPKVFEHKDGVLFFGNFKINYLSFTEAQKTAIKAKSDNITFDYKSTEYDKVNDYYNYEGLLGKDNTKVQTFKYLEWYRIGIQFQHKNGRFSDIVWITDLQNDKAPYVKDNKIYTATIKCDITDFSTIVGEDYKKYRIMIVQPTSQFITAFSQGIVSSTLFNYQDRYNNAPFAIASWKMRPIGKHFQCLDTNNSRNGEIQNLDKTSGAYEFYEKGQLEYTLYYNTYETTYPGDNDTNITTYYCKLQDSVGNIIVTCNTISFAEVKKTLTKYILLQDIPEQQLWESEVKSKKFETNQDQQSDLSKTVQNNSNVFFYDESIVTLNSPDIENDYHKFSPTTKFRILGVLGEQKLFSNYSIEGENLQSISSSGQFNTELKNIDNQPLWNDTYYNTNEKKWIKALYATYIWHNDTSLGGSTVESEDKYSKLVRKVISNTRNCTTFYLDNPWKALDATKDICAGITQPKIVLGTEDTMVALESNQGEDYINNSLLYQANVDKVIIYPTGTEEQGELSYDIYGIPMSNIENQGSVFNKEYEALAVSKDPVHIKYKQSPHAVFSFKSWDGITINSLPTLNSKGKVHVGWDTKNHKISEYFWKISTENKVTSLDYIGPRDSFSNPFIGALLYDESLAESEGIGFYKIENIEQGNVVYREVKVYDEELYYNGDKLYQVYLEYPIGLPLIQRIKEVNKEFAAQDNITLSVTSQNDYFYLGEFYTQENNPYADIQGDSVESLQWIPTDQTYKINEVAYGGAGDTYYQRWDCLKTYPFDSQDKNQYIDITSFMVESRINLDSRYDGQRGLKNNLGANGSNFNLLNPNYTQNNNFFNYRAIKESEENNYSNQITFTKSKLSNSDIDNWTNITLANIVSLDGSKGEIKSIKKHNNDLYCFQDSAISKLLYNSRVQINASDGIPIEIGNSSKLEDYVYITTTTGCQNRHSIKSTPKGLYFIDSNSSILYRISDSIYPLSSNKVGSWMKKLSLGAWTPNHFTVKLNYNQNTQDVYITTDTECLAYNEQLEEFSSFYSYDNVYYTVNFNNSTIQVDSLGNLWAMNKGNFNEMFGTYKNYIIGFIVNSDFQYDKIFETVEFTSEDISNRNSLLGAQDYYPLTQLVVQNEYQAGASGTNTLKKKFRVWRWQIPRDSSNNRDRIRNTWTEIRMMKDNRNKDNRQNKIYNISTVYYV